MDRVDKKLGIEIKFPIIADDMGKIGTLYGMIHPGKDTNTIRAVFIIEPNGIMSYILYYPQETGRNTDEILRVFRAFQTADKNSVATPANWPTMG